MTGSGNAWLPRARPRGVPSGLAALVCFAALAARVCTALGDGYFRLDNLSRAREIWSAALAKFPGDAALRSRVEKQGQQLEWLVGAALSADRRVDTSLTGLLPKR